MDGRAAGDAPHDADYDEATGRRAAQAAEEVDHGEPDGLQGDAASRVHGGACDTTAPAGAGLPVGLASYRRFETVKLHQASAREERDAREERRQFRLAAKERMRQRGVELKQQRKQQQITNAAVHKDVTVSHQHVGNTLRAARHQGRQRIERAQTEWAEHGQHLVQEFVRSHAIPVHWMCGACRPQRCTFNFPYLCACRVLRGVPTVGTAVRKVTARA